MIKNQEETILYIDKEPKLVFPEKKIKFYIFSRDGKVLILKEKKRLPL